MKLCAVVFSLLTNLFTLNAVALSTSSVWTRIDIQTTKQVTQIDAGFPKGCSITTLLYALKFGPDSWKQAYKSLPGDSDVQKIKSIATKFSSIVSQNSKSEPLFSEKYGANPEDMRQMFQSLVPVNSSPSEGNYFLPTHGSESRRNDFFNGFRSDLHQRLSSGHPIPLALYFSNPQASHAVLTVGMKNSIDQDGTIHILVLDPMSGKVSEAAIKMETLPLFNSKLEGFSFSDASVADRKGFILSIFL